MEDMVKIVDLQMKEIQERLGENGLKIELTEAARKWLAEAVMTQLLVPGRCAVPCRNTSKSPFHSACLSGEFSRDAHIIADVNEAQDGLVFSARLNSRLKLRFTRKLPDRNI